MTRWLAILLTLLRTCALGGAVAACDLDPTEPTNDPADAASVPAEPQVPIEWAPCRARCLHDYTCAGRTPEDAGAAIAQCVDDCLVEVRAEGWPTTLVEGAACAEDVQIQRCDERPPDSCPWGDAGQVDAGPA